ncbi:ADP-ribose diphosphatase [Colwellia hornerae]|uniref:ADP-ribose pyrophosphatase n=1 Tax=Colwellia hornerae TaxID=89402 RepID=A0A5C6QCZ4_9GAMM|nr:ADP-ribose diphosphatase [Colwellia hornerae]TWX51654.1 ADP-ribose diphosphatase [Colwellia hornerae]TWX57442.1 ADP-ribose diphosphatase [Colwellia hornerae]TWX66945.1 ADP-ribose diphosphatase [Colwellia hornerae]
MDKKNTNSSQFSHKDVTIYQQETCYQGVFKMDEYQLSHRLFDGGESKILRREVFERGHAVVVIPYDAANDRVVLIEQFRVGAIGQGDTPWLLEFVAGMFGEGESPIEVAIREAKEEADLTLKPSQLDKVLEYFSSPGGMSEVIHLYVANVDSENVSGVHGLESESEDILLHVMPREQAMSLLENGKITNAATIIGLQWLQNNFHQLQQKWSS